MPSDSERDERGTNRLGAFIDAVFAIAITFPIVRLEAPRIPTGGDLPGALARLGPEYVTYALSFLVIGLYWTYSHFSAQLVRRADHGYNLLTLLFLASVSVTPFPAQPYVEHVADPANVRSASLLYGCALSVPAVVWLVRWQWGLSRGLYHELTAGFVRRVTLRYAASCVGCIAGCAIIAFDHPYVGMTLVALSNLAFLLPPEDIAMKQGTEDFDLS